ncbi:hypothetical protein MauCBS54593_008053, partial [Microsporum audouinii]
MANFNDNPSPLPSRYCEAFDSYCEILREDEGSLANRLKQRRNERQRIRRILTDIYVEMGPTPFFLCTIAVPKTRLGGAAPQDIFVQFQSWWKGSPPRGLTMAAEKICEDKAIKTLMPLSRN